jgi:hypothetical protein
MVFAPTRAFRICCGASDCRSKNYAGFNRDELTTNAETIRRRDKRVVIENGEHKGKAGDGQFLKRGECVRI